VRDQFHAFAAEKITPHAHGWHMRDELIPLTLIEEMGALGVFGLTAPEVWGGSGMGKVAMCVVSEALSRGWIGTGSLGTRSEIAAELILAHGTPDQKQRYLPRITSGEIIPQRCSPSRRRARTSPRSAPARCWKTAPGRSAAPRPGSPTPPAPT
jgi:(2S)-methylsuccinyl-CoA dehydrogenase